MKKIDGLDEDVFFERCAADVLERTTASNWDAVLSQYMAPWLPKIADAVDAHTASIAEDIVALMMVGALTECGDDTAKAIRFLRGEVDE